MSNKIRAIFFAALIAASAALSACGTAAKDNSKEDTVEPLASRETINFNTGWLYSPEDYKNGEIKKPVLAPFKVDASPELLAELGEILGQECVKVN